MYDFFIAHAGADVKPAERLFDLLSKESRVFLDSRCLKLGDQWDIVLPQAQRQSRVTIVIVSPRTEAAFYQQEEVAAAIDLAKRDGHRVVPVYVGEPPREGSVPPYGLRRLHSAQISKQFKLEDLARELLAQLAADTGGPGQRRKRVQRQPAAKAQSAGEASLPDSPPAKPQRAKPQRANPQIVTPKLTTPLWAMPQEPAALSRLVASGAIPKIHSVSNVKVVRDRARLELLALSPWPEGQARLDITEKGFLLSYTDGQLAWLPNSLFASSVWKRDEITISKTRSRIVFGSAIDAAVAAGFIADVAKRVPKPLYGAPPAT